MPTTAVPTCVAYDDTRTACVVGTADGELVFRERASSASAAASTASIDASRASPHSNLSTSAWTREATARATDAGVGIIDVALSDASHGRVVAASTESGEISFWRASANAGGAGGGAGVSRLGSVRVDGGARARQIAFAPTHDALTLAAACDDGVVRFYEPRDALTATAWESSDVFESARPGGRATSLAWRRSSERVSASITHFPILAVGTSWPRDARHTVSALARDERARRWRVVAEMENDDGDDEETSRLAWSATTTARGALSLVAARGSTCVIYEFTGVTPRGVESTKTMGRLRHPRRVTSCDWNASGSVIATAAEDGVVRMWSANLKDGAWCEHAVAG